MEQRAQHTAQRTAKGHANHGTNARRARSTEAHAAQRSTTATETTGTGPRGEDCQRATSRHIAKRAPYHCLFPKPIRPLLRLRARRAAGSGVGTAAASRPPQHSLCTMLRLLVVPCVCPPISPPPCPAVAAVGGREMDAAAAAARPADGDCRPSAEQRSWPTTDATLENKQRENEEADSDQCTSVGVRCWVVRRRQSTPKPMQL